MDWKAYASMQADPAAALSEAQRRVAVCAERRDDGLALGGLGLQRLPDGISALTWLRHLDLYGCGITDFSPLATLSNLESLQIGSMKCPFPGLDFMSGWTRLQALEILTPSVVDLRPAAACASLKRLNVWCTQGRIDLLNLDALATLQGLEFLSLNGVQSERLDVIGQWTGLRVVLLYGTSLTTLTGFETLHQLKSLSVTETSVSDLSPLAGLTALEELNLRDTEVSDLSPLAGLPSLNSIDISNTQVSDLSPLQRLARCQREFDQMKRAENRFWVFKGLESLKIARSKVSDISAVGHLDGIRHFDLSETDVSSIAPLHACKALWSLDLAGTAVTDLGRPGSLSQLQSINASKTQIANLQALEPASSLQTLNIAETNVSDLTPIRRAHECRSLNLRASQVVDISQIIDTGKNQADHRYSHEALDFRDTPASRASERCAELAALAETSPGTCFLETKRHLRELASPSALAPRRGFWSALIERRPRA
ncbi:leucine-rich repeat domain-containing protein [Bradyrhizobium mercantei]|uniref:leucine-rich repeat domain-containing protein n=1 Tax=Bradyrhizobium mercantei TaxID=1904807 RepID=UPI0009771952|nr:leucine-rich repeat domain-containing protein [Bradyrhizobium mercantei]